MAIIRHLNESQRLMVGDNIAQIKRGDNQHTAIAGTSQQEIAELMNLSVDSLGRARKVHEQETPELIQKVKSGELSLSAADKVNF